MSTSMIERKNHIPSSNLTYDTPVVRRDSKAYYLLWLDQLVKRNDGLGDLLDLKVFFHELFLL